MASKRTLSPSNVALGATPLRALRGWAGGPGTRAGSQSRRRPGADPWADARHRAPRAMVRAIGASSSGSIRLSVWFWYGAGVVLEADAVDHHDASRSRRPSRGRALADAGRRIDPVERVRDRHAAGQRMESHQVVNGMIAPRLRSSFPSDRRSRPVASWPRNTERHRIAGRGPRHQPHELRVVTGGAVSVGRARREVSRARPHRSGRKSNETVARVSTCDSSGSRSESSNVREPLASVDIRHWRLRASTHRCRRRSRTDQPRLVDVVVAARSSRPPAPSLRLHRSA